LVHTPIMTHKNGNVEVPRVNCFHFALKRTETTSVGLLPDRP